MAQPLDFHELVRALEEHPEWRQELRRLLLTEELLQLPEVVRELATGLGVLSREVQNLAEAQRRTDERLEALAAEVARLAEAQRRTDERLEALAAEVARLAEAQRRTEQRVEELAEAQRRTEQRVEELAEAQRRTEQRVEELAEAQRRTEQRVEELAEAQRRTEQRVEELAEAQRRTEQRLGDLLGRDLERSYRERAAAYFGRILSGLEVLDTHTLAKMLDQARELGRISLDEREEILWADVVVRGRDERGQEMGFVVEVSSIVGRKDVERAVRRAELCTKALGFPMAPAVAGRKIPEEVAALARSQGVWQFLNGRTQPPENSRGNAKSA